MKLNFFLGLVLFTFSLIGLAQQSGSNDSTTGNDFDLDTLIDRVSHSKSLGIFTKLSLKKDIDQLLENIRDHHGGAGDSSLEQLRERYDVMVHKLVVLLQEKDKELVKSIDDSRDKIWAILSDEKKFANL